MNRQELLEGIQELLCLEVSQSSLLNDSSKRIQTMFIVANIHAWLVLGSDSDS